MALQAGKLQPTESEEHSPRNNLVLVVNADVDEATSGASEIQESSQVLETSDTSETSSEDNRVLRTVEEFSHLHREMHDVRENLVALGAPFQTVGVLVEMGFNNRHDEQEKMIQSCLESSKVNGIVESAIEDKFRQQLLQLTELERDMAHARKLARESGMLLPALNSLTNMIRQNPGDGGELIINTFVAYALASGVKLDKTQEILESSRTKNESVLPVIELDTPDPRETARKALIRDMILSFCITVFIMWLVV